MNGEESILGRLAAKEHEKLSFYRSVARGSGVTERTFTHNEPRDLKIEPNTYGSTRAAHNLADMLQKHNDRYLCRKVSGRLNSLAKIAKEVTMCDAPLWLKKWALERARDEFKSAMERFPCADETEVAVRDHVLSVGKSYITNAIEDSIRYNAR